MRLSLAIEGFLLFRAGAGSISTMREYANTLHKWVKLIGDIDTAEVSADHVRRYLYHLRIEEQLAPKSVKNAWIGMSAFFTWLEGEMGIEHVIRRYKIKMPAAQSREIVPLSKTDLRSHRRVEERQTGAGYHATRYPRPRPCYRADLARHRHAGV